MYDPNTCFLFGPLETSDVGGDQVDQQHTAEKITSGKNGDLKRGAFRYPINEKAAKELVLGLEQTDFNLRKCADED